MQPIMNGVCKFYFQEIITHIRGAIGNILRYISVLGIVSDLNLSISLQPNKTRRAFHIWFEKLCKEIMNPPGDWW